MVVAESAVNPRLKLIIVSDANSFNAFCLVRQAVFENVFEVFQEKIFL